MLPILKKHDKLEYSDADTHGESWWRERVRRYISSSDEDRAQLWERLDALVQRYKQACPDGWTTFTDADGHGKIRIDVVHATVQVLIVEDRLSDPETNDMYFYIGDDKFGVPKSITVRGTTQVRVSDRKKRGLYNHIFGNRGAVRCALARSSKLFGESKSASLPRRILRQKQSRWVWPLVASFTAVGSVD